MNDESKIKKSSVIGKLGIGLILLSGVFFFTMLSVPLWSVSAGSKVVIGGGLFVGVQIAWWSGAALAGPATVKVIRSWFRRG